MRATQLNTISLITGPLEFPQTLPPRETPPGWPAFAGHDNGVERSDGACHTDIKSFRETKDAQSGCRGIRGTAQGSRNADGAADRHGSPAESPQCGRLPFRRASP